jgi:hypothetical protein
MKSLFPLFFLMFAFQLKASEVQHDVIFKSRFDLDSSQGFIQQLRIFLSHNNFGDPYNQELKKSISIDLNALLDEVPEDTQTWIRTLQSILKIKLFESDYKVVVENLGYSLKDFNAEFRTGPIAEERIEYVTINYVNGLRLKADKISFVLELKTTQADEKIKFRIDLIAPEFLVRPELNANLPMGWLTTLQGDNVLLRLEKIDIKDVMEKIAKNPHLIDFKMQDLLMPKISAKIGSKIVTLDQEKIKNFLLSRRESFKKGILDILNVKLGDRFSNIIIDNPKELKLPRTYVLSEEVSAVFKIDQMLVNNTGIVQIGLDGFFCDLLPTRENNFCRDHQLKTDPRRPIDPDLYRRSLRELNRTIIERKANIAVSVSEQFLNELIDATIKNGLWDNILNGKDFKLGAERSFILAEEKGELFSLYLDIIYKLKGTDRILVGRPELRFPVKLMIALKVVEIQDIPHFEISVKKVATDEKLLLSGVPSLNLPTTVNGVPRFRKKVVNSILSEVNAFEGQTLIDVEVKELIGTYFHRLELYSDGLGRGTATLGFLLKEDK